MPWKFTSMELSDEEKLDMVCPVPLPDRPKFPYGLRITLCTPELAKLKMTTSDCSVGDTIDLRAMAEVTSISENEGPNGKECRIELQIKDLATENESTEDEPDQKTRPPFRKVAYDRKRDEP